MAQIDIGKLTFTHKGDYAGGTAYVANDVVYYNGSAYIAKTSTTGNLPTSTAHWNTFAAGSGGIWNAGLSLGSANQVVAVNSGASALEFQNVSSDFVKIASGNTTANATIDIQGCFSTSYKFYKLLLAHNFATGAYIEVGLLNASDNSHNSSNYYSFGGSHYSGNHSGNSRYTNSNGASTSIFAQNDTGGFRPVNTWGNDKTDELSITEMFFANPIDTKKTMVKMHSTWSQSGYVGIIHSIGMHADTGSMSGLRLQSNDGVQNFTTNGFYAVYGMKQ